MKHETKTDRALRELHFLAADLRELAECERARDEHKAANVANEFSIMLAARAAEELGL